MREGQRLIFVGGLHRSGTTPLARALASHEDVTGLTGTGVSEDEGQHLQDVYPKIRAHGGMGRFANAEAAHLTEESPLNRPESARRLLAAWEPYWDLDKQYLLEKSPSNMIMGRFLQALFPESSMIVIMRHPVVVALALQKWNPWLVGRRGRTHVSLQGMVAHWLRAYDVLRADSTYLRRLHVMRDEDLVARPQQEIDQIQHFLGLGSEISAAKITPGHSSRYAEQWTRMQTGNAWDRRRRRIIEDRYAERIAEYGYDVSDLSRLDEWSFAS
jgi:hypothetical protein